MIVLIHGLYDALISLPDLLDYSFFSFTAYIYLSYLFFHEYRGLRTPSRETVSLTGNFVFGASTVYSTTLVYLCASVPLETALLVIAGSALEMAMLVYMFLRELR
jgi:hypothetical protein